MSIIINFFLILNFHSLNNMMAEDINSLRKNLDELKLELEQEQKEHLAVD